MPSISSVADLTFLNEPAWRWLVFFIALMLFLIAWNSVIDYMK